MKTIAPGKVYVPLYKRWWFWALVACGVVATWQAVLYFNWQGDMTKYQIRNAVADAYMQREQDKADALEAAYKADTYGGATPEETLKLFIDALEKKDYELASKYFVVEEQQRQKDGFKSLSTKQLSFYLDVLNYRHEVKLFNNQVESSIDFFRENEQVHFEHLVLNPFTKLWKLTDK